MDSQLFAGYSGPADGTGSFNVLGIVNSFRVTSTTDGFANSLVMATTFLNVSLASVETDNGDTEFGFQFHDRMSRLAVQSPALRYDPKGPAEQNLAGDFFVKKL